MGKAEDTRRRILDAAAVEFGEHGIAGARVDRIAAAAGANKSLIYAYVGDKDTLFDVVFTSRVDASVDAVPLTVDDLPGYATRWYDAYLADPLLLRLLTWARLERQPTGDLYAAWPDHDEAKLAAIAEAQAAGRLVDDVAPHELWAMLVGLGATWAQAAIVHAASADDPPHEHAARRQALARTVRRAFYPDPPVA